MDVKRILSEIKPLIDREIEKIIPKQGNPQILFDGCWHYLGAGGKRFRPSLIAIACETLGGKIEDTIPAGVSLELAHTFLLVHDDIEDYSEIRRGKPAMHIKFGTSQAINIGDFLFMKTYEAALRGQKNWGLEKTQRILNLLTAMYSITAEGQAMEIEQRDRPLSDATVEWYKKLVLKKTANYTGGFPCQVGAIIADGSEEQIETLRQFGLAIGTAFQIQDDILNVVMKEEEEKIAPGTEGGGVGKDFAGDIAEGKRTLILSHAYQNANEEDKKILEELIGKPNVTVEEKKRVIGILNKYNSINYSKEYARNILQKALKDLRENFSENQGRKKLEALAEYFVEREF